jgi:peptide/nickel transport system substrate-binding protein
MHAHIKRIRPALARRRPAALGLLAIVVAALALTACGSTSDSGGTTGTTATASGTQAAEKIVEGGTLRVASAAPPTSIDPVTVASGSGFDIVGAVDEQLTYIDEHGKAQPVLATKWEPSADGKTWTFTLRKGVKWQDGTPLTAADVAASYERIIGPKSVSPGKSAFEGILESVSASGDDAVEFHLERPFADFPVLTAGSNTYILPKDYKLGSWEDDPVGTGPFTLQTYDKGQSAKFVANPDYWGKQDIHLAGLEVGFYKDAQARVLALESGEADTLLGEPVAASLTAALDPSKYSALTVPEAGFTAFALRVDQAPFNDVKVRQAIAWALNREAILKTVYGGDGSVGNDTMYAPIYPIKPEGLEQREQDPDKVAELLGGKTVSFTITASPTDETLATVIQQQLNEVGGFDVKIDILPSNEYYAEGNDAPWLSAPATLTYWGSRPSPSQYNSFLYFKNSDWNASKFSNPELEKLSAQYDATTDPTEQQDLVNQIGKIEWTEVPVIVAARGATQTFSSNEVHDIPAVPGQVRYQGIWVG